MSVCCVVIGWVVRKGHWVSEDGVESCFSHWHVSHEPVRVLPHLSHKGQSDSLTDSLVSAGFRWVADVCILCGSFIWVSLWAPGVKTAIGKRERPRSFLFSLSICCWRVSELRSLTLRTSSSSTNTRSAFMQLCLHLWIHPKWHQWIQSLHFLIRMCLF